MLRRLHFLVLGAILYSPLAAMAAESTDQQNLCSGAGLTCTDKSGSAVDTTQALLTSIGTIGGTLLTVAGAIAVIVIIVGGIRYVTSQGDSAAVKSAKDTILYAVIGLIVAIVAYAIVHYVIGNIH